MRPPGPVAHAKCNRARGSLLFPKFYIRVVSPHVDIEGSVSIPVRTTRKKQCIVLHMNWATFSVSIIGKRKKKQKLKPRNGDTDRANLETFALF
jgi:hypothetical protein